MAEFDLGKVLMTADAIKNARRQSTVDQLQQQYLQTRNDAARQEMDFAAQKNQRDNDMQTHRNVYAKSQAIIAAAQSGRDPKALASALAPEIIQQHEAQYGQGSWNAVTPEQVVADAQRYGDIAFAQLGMTPVSVQDVGGTKVLTQNGEFKGQLSTPKPLDNTPNSYDEFALAQKDPGFAQFLRERREKGFSMTLPDGTTLSMGGGVGPGELTKPTVNELQKGAISAQAGIDRLQNIRAGFDPKWLSYKEQATQYVNSIKAKAQGLPFVSKLTPQEESDLSAFSRFKSDTLDNLNRYITEITGAAMGVEEAKRIESTMPNLNDDPASFQTKLTRVEERLKLIIARSVYTQKNGQKYDAISVDEMRSIMNRRGDEIYKENLQRTGDQSAAKSATIQALQSEFYQ